MSAKEIHPALPCRGSFFFKDEWGVIGEVVHVNTLILKFLYNKIYKK
jgi:hypothetical protein